MKRQMRWLAGLLIVTAGCAVAISVASCGTAGCPPTPVHCIAGYRFNTQTCGCDQVTCTTNADCANLGQVVCDKGVCAASSTVDKCAAVFTCSKAVTAGGTCDCHLDCQCDPGNASGLGATYCVGANTCMPRCSDQSDPALFCDCYTLGTACAPNGSCAPTCKGQADCSVGTCTGGFCVVALNNSINTAPCLSDAGSD